MKCPNCHNLNTAEDVACFRCGQSLRLPSNVEPMWTYLFVVACGLIPVVMLGGIIPIMVGCGGAGGCLTVGRWGSLPRPLRFVICTLITVACWGLMALFVYAAILKLKR